MLTVTATTLQQHAAQQTHELLPSATWRMLAASTVKPRLPRGLDAVWDAGVGHVRRSLLRRHRFMNRAAAVLATQTRFGTMSQPALCEIAQRMRDRFRRGRETDEDLNEALGLAREMVFRCAELRLHRVQAAAALAMLHGGVAELATGEGKTLAALLAAAVAGWRGRGCHVITVNDYLATRDAQLLAPIYEALGLRVACVTHESSDDDRRNAYAADVTYVTNKEVAADYLRDRIKLGSVRGLTGSLVRQMVQRIEQERAPDAGLVMRGLDTALIDEADSVLIDEAVTPLIIASATQQADGLAIYGQAQQLTQRLAPGVHYEVDPRFREIHLTAAGRMHLREVCRGMEGPWKSQRRREELLIQALTAREFFLRDQQYVLVDDKVVIIDESTGRLQPDRTWREGLHQAIEAKEGLTLTPPQETLARVSFQRFFRLYRTLGGMTGTAEESRAELWNIYHLPAVAIPTHRPVVRQRLPDRVFVNEQAKLEALLDHTMQVHATGRPILIGTRSVETSQRIAQMLEAVGLPCDVINAVRHGHEAQVVARAGELQRITVATNMAGRGTDIKLGPGVRDVGGLHVIVAEVNLSARIDRQLFGRSGRQGDPGSCVRFLSLDDELLRRYGSRLAAVTLKARGNDRGELHPRYARLFEWAQARAEAVALAQRKAVLRQDDWLDESLGFAGKN